VALKSPKHATVGFVTYPSALIYFYTVTDKRGVEEEAPPVFPGASPKLSPEEEQISKRRHCISRGTVISLLKDISSVHVKKVLSRDLSGCSRFFAEEGDGKPGRRRGGTINNGTPP
jgi:hypothetical protein